ncbi:hypothetical protein DN062_03580 [Nitrincola tibetensis]|uniref:Uncharacterized protein n=1 Tax=Nitrincola tibetensis TaxID=2219697 RepID=A0A364NQP3_9GAMM|nr:hypothetical protein [Nitrincola tibetensis]RAU19352.1 hypothetical protein DN062_03580 [Nitrincola tibetensis]
MDSLFQQIDTCPDLYAIQQLVFVNSSSFAYTEIRVDQHTALFGRNNLGKTSMLNALKLFLLPEENFKRCDQKFGFRSSTGESYSTQESFNYYFPEQHSFILLEAENLYGPFCVLLHQGRKEFSYARIVIPCSYEKIRHLFWDFTADCNDGLGAPIQGLSLESIQQALKLFNSESLHDSKTVRDRLFSHRPLNRDEGRYCLLPLKQGGTERELAAWKQLIHLAFDIGANNTRTLPDALATIIEGEKQRKADELSVDLNQILQDYDALRHERDELQRITNAKDDWIEFDALYRDYETQSREVGQFYVDLKSVLEREQGHIDPLIEKAVEEDNEAQNAVHASRKLFTDTCDQIKLYEGKMEEITNQIKRCEGAVTRITAIERGFPDLNPDEVLAQLQQQVKQKSSFVEELKNEAQRLRRMEQLNSQLIHDKRQRDKLSTQLSEHKPSVLEQLDSQSASLLYNLIPDLADISPALDPSTSKILRDFAQLFEVRENELCLLNEALPNIEFAPFNPEQIRQSQLIKLDKLQQSIKSQDKELSELMSTSRLSQVEQRNKLKHEEGELRVLELDLEMIKARETHIRQFKEATAAFDDLKVVLDDARHKVSSYKQDLDKYEGNAAKIRKALHELKQKKQTLTVKLTRLNSIANGHAVLKGWESKLSPLPRTIADTALDGLEHQCQKIAKVQEKLMNALRILLSQKLLDTDGSEAYLMSFDLSKVRALRQEFERLFSSLDAVQVDYDNRVRTHNKHTSIQMDVLRDAGQQVRGFISEINHEFKHYKVSNLEEVQLICDLHPRFQLLLNDLGKINFYHEALHDARLYQRLNDFCNEFFKEGERQGRVLQLHQLIERVRYRFRLAGQDQFTENAQSNGTTSMVNSLLLSILLKRLLAKDARICLPLVMDEMGSIDQQNLLTAVSIAEQHGFVLFGANPDMSAEIVNAVNHYINLGMFKATEKSYNPKRRVVYHGACESLRLVQSNSKVEKLTEAEA